MGDRCYMHVTCRRQDRARFEALGFELEYEEAKDCPIIEMADQEANYAHCDEMPADIPYHGYNGGGGNYGEGRIACDGTRFTEIPATDDGFVVQWDYEAQQPTAESIEEIRFHLEVRAAVVRMFKEISAAEPKKPGAVEG